MHKGIFRILGSVMGILIVILYCTFVFAEELKISSGAAAVENIFKKIQKPIAEEINLSLTLNPVGPQQAWRDLDSGKVEAAAAGLSLADWISLMAEEGYHIDDPSVYYAQTIGLDSIKILTHKENPVKKLTSEQLAGIFTGKLTNWQQVGGFDVPITVVLGTKMAGALTEFRRKIFPDQDYLKTPLSVGTAAEVKQAIKNTPGAIGLGTMAQVDGTVNSPRYEGVIRIVTILTKGAPNKKVQDLIQYIYGSGKMYLKK